MREKEEKDTSSALVGEASQRQLSNVQCRRWEATARNLAQSRESSAADLVLVEWDDDLAMAIPQVPADDDGEVDDAMVELSDT